MSQFILIGFNKELDKLRIFGKGSFEDLTKEKSVLSSFYDGFKFKEVELSDSLSLDDLLTNDKLVLENYAYIKDMVLEDEQDMNKGMMDDIQSSLDETELF